MLNDVLGKIFDLTWNLVKIIGGLYLLILAIMALILTIIIIFDKAGGGRKLDNVLESDSDSDMRKIFDQIDKAHWADLVYPQAGPPEIETMVLTKEDADKFIAVMKELHEDSK